VEVSAMVIGLTVATAAAATLDVDGGTIQAFVLPAGIEATDADAVVEVQPDPLVLTAEGEDVTATVSFPVDDGSIGDVSSIRLCLGALPCEWSGVGATLVEPGAAGRVLARFARADVVGLLAGLGSQKGVAVTLSVCGVVGDRGFGGTDTITVLVPAEDPSSLPSPTPTETPSPSPSDPLAPTEEPTPAAG
jgi:hypothetical protein